MLSTAGSELHAAPVSHSAGTGVLRLRKHFAPRSACCAQDDIVNSGLGDRAPHPSPLLRDVGRGHNCLWPVRRLAGIMALRLLCYSTGHNARRLKACPAKSAAHGYSAEPVYQLPLYSKAWKTASPSTKLSRCSTASPVNRCRPCSTSPPTHNLRAFLIPC